MQKEKKNRSVNTCKIRVMHIANSQKCRTRHLVVQIPRTGVLWAFSVNVLSINAPNAVREVHVGCSLKLWSREVNKMCFGDSRLPFSMLCYIHALNLFLAQLDCGHTMTSACMRWAKSQPGGVSRTSAAAVHVHVNTAAVLKVFNGAICKIQNYYSVCMWGGVFMNFG